MTIPTTVGQPEAVVVCGAVAERCICDLPPDHLERDEPHLCKCTGSWRGDLDGDDFEIVTWPKPLSGEFGWPS